MFRTHRQLEGRFSICFLTVESDSALTLRYPDDLLAGDFCDGVEVDGESEDVQQHQDSSNEVESLKRTNK